MAKTRRRKSYGERAWREIQEAVPRDAGPGGRNLYFNHLPRILANKKRLLIHPIVAGVPRIKLAEIRAIFFSKCELFGWIIERRVNDLGLTTTHTGASLIELLVVIFIMGIMMSLLLPALQRARGKADEMVCENNLYQLKFGLAHFMDAKRQFPAQNEWTVDILAYIEQRPLADIMKQGFPLGCQVPSPAIDEVPLPSRLRKPRARASTFATTC